MGHIKEPEGVDFVIKSRPLTKEEEEEEVAISNYIRAYKARHARKKNRTDKIVSTKKQRHLVTE